MYRARRGRIELDEAFDVRQTPPIEIHHVGYPPRAHERQQPKTGESQQGAA
jgi:hypothetical protein